MINLSPLADPKSLTNELRKLSDTIRAGHPITPDKQNDFAITLLQVADAVRLSAMITTHYSVRDWIADEDERDSITGDEINEVFRRFDRSDMESYELHDMLRSCLDEVIAERKPAKKKKKGGRRA
jgi:hypothetical protein